MILGITVAGVGAYAQKLNIRLFMMIWMVCYFGISLFSALLLHWTGLETLQFSANPGVLIFVLVFGFWDVGLCWLFRNNAICHINPIVVALISPLSAVITGISSVILGTDPLTPNLVIGSVIITTAVILSGIGELKAAQKDGASHAQ